jgi:hypothetical protein
MIAALQIPGAGIAEALAEIIRLGEKIIPARLRPLNLSHRNGQAASDAVIAKLRRGLQSQIANRKSQICS